MKKKLLIIGIALVVYSFVLAALGVFGLTLQSAALFCLTYILPIILIIFGYFLCIWLPFRIMEALRINKEKKLAREKEDKLAQIQATKKSFEQKILEHLNKGESL